MPSATDRRPTWAETRIEMARVIARRSLCTRDQVGAIITDEQNKIIGEGYNGPPAGFKRLPTNVLIVSGKPSPRFESCTHWCPRAQHGDNPAADYSDCPALHAEANALMMSDRSLRAGGTIYVTSHVCFTCAKLIANSGLKRVYVEVVAENSHRNAKASYEFMLGCGLNVYVLGVNYEVTYES